jgi:hypothetical protein
MKILAILLLTYSYSVGQTVEIFLKDFKFNEIAGQYSIIWSADKNFVIGENLRLGKRKKFEYTIFAIGINGGGANTNKALMTGKFLIKNDTIKLKIKKKYHSHGSEIYSFRSEYLIKRFDLITEFNEVRKVYRFTCLIHPSLSNTFSSKVDNLKMNLSNTALEKFDDPAYSQIIEISQEVERIFWKDRLFLKKE